MFLICLPSTDWARPTHIVKAHLLYSKSAYQFKSESRLKNTSLAILRLAFDQTSGFRGPGRFDAVNRLAPQALASLQSDAGPCSHGLPGTQECAPTPTACPSPTVLSGASRHPNNAERKALLTLGEQDRIVRVHETSHVNWKSKS